MRALIVAMALLVPAVAWAHAFPDHSDPRVGHSLDRPPAQVRIWFDGEIEPVFSTLRVENARKQRVDTGDAHVDPKDNTLLEATLQPSLPPGKYHVYWSVVARDGHRTDGDYPFTIK